MVRADEVARVEEFRHRLVAYASFVTDNVHGLGYGEQLSARARVHIGQEQSWLAQEYGAIHGTIARYGTAMMTQFGGIASQDAVRDAISNPTHPSYADLARGAVGHLDVIIGRLRAEAASRRVSMDDVYRVTSPVFWVARLLAPAEHDAREDRRSDRRRDPGPDRRVCRGLLYEAPGLTARSSTGLGSDPGLHGKA